MPGDEDKQPYSARVRADDQLFLLSLDGGGVRGLSSLMILKQLMETINPRQPPKPCDYFDMIGGTSTGGLIAIMLGRMRLTVDECITAYNELAPRVFTKIHHRINLRNGEMQGRFDHIALEREVRALLKTYRMDPEALLQEPEEGSSCKVFVARLTIGRPVVFSSYHNPRRSSDRLSKVKIWEAARATSAATTFFDPITIGGETFVDSATGANNPINYLWLEAGDVWSDGEGLDEHRVRCLVSIGTGSPSLVPFGPDVASVAKALKAISADTEVTASVFQKHHSKLFTNGNAFRFNVVAGLESVGLQEVDRWEDIAAATRAYIEEQEAFMTLKKCALMLQERQSTDALARNIIEFARPSIEYLNNPNNHIPSKDLQWLTHTVSYTFWQSPRPKSSILYCQPAQDCPWNSVAASVAQLPSRDLKAHNLSESGGEPSVFRSLYFRCLEEPSDGRGGISNANQRSVSANHVLVSLVCQSLLVDDRFEDLTGRLRMLTRADRQSIQLALSNPESAPVEAHIGLLARTLWTGHRPGSIAIDNVHLIRASGLSALLTSLKALFGRKTSPGWIPIILSGRVSADAVPELRGELHVDSSTEYRECVACMHCRDWNTRRDQFEHPDKGTNEWIWTHPEYKAWDAAQKGILWIEGKPRSGKSVLARSMQRRTVASWEQNATEPSRHFRAPDQSRKPIIAGWFYSTRLGDVGISHSSFLRSLIFQILRQEPSFFHTVVADYYRKFPASLLSTLPNEEGVPELAFHSFCGSPDFEAVGRQILERVAAAGTSIICIIDAMDEARPSTDGMLQGASVERRSKMLTILGTLARLVIGVQESRMKFILLSRPEPLIELDFLRAHRKLESTFRITLERGNGTDIEVLVDHGITCLQTAFHTYDSDSDIDVDCRRDKAKRKVPLGNGMDRALQNLQASEADALQRIRDYILEHARGVILWVTLILKDLQQTAAGGMFTFTELESRLKSLPLELDDHYFSIIQGLRAKLTSAGELQKSRNIFTLVAGAGSFGRPLSLEELWEALAVSSELEPALQSKTDPIIPNRVIISSWSDFRRQLGRYCGPLIEILKKDEDEASPPSREVLPGDTVQFIHRTVKEFFDGRKNVEEFRIDEAEARRQVDQLARRYLALCLPPEKPLYWPVLQATEDKPLEWEKNVASLVEYLDSRILLPFSVHVASTGGQPIPEFEEVAGLMDGMIYPPIPAWDRQQIRAHFSEETKYYPGFRGHRHSRVMLRAVMLGHAVLHGCLQGCVTAARNLVLLFGPRGRLGPYTGDNDYVMLNGALRAAIWSGLLQETRQLTYDNRYLKNTLRNRSDGWVERDAFVKLSIKAGFVDILRHLISLTKWLALQKPEPYNSVVASFQDLTNNPALKEVIPDIIEEAVTKSSVEHKRVAAITPSFYDTGAELPVRELDPIRGREHQSDVREAVRVVCRLL